MALYLNFESYLIIICEEILNLILHIKSICIDASLYNYLDTIILDNHYIAPKIYYALILNQCAIYWILLVIFINFTLLK